MLAFRPILRIAALLACSALPVLAQGVRVKLPAWPELVLLDSMRTEHEIAGAPEAGYGALQKARSEEHTAELQSLAYLVCRLLL